MIRKSKEGEITLKKVTSGKVKRKEERKNDSYVILDLILLQKSCISILYIEK